MQALLNSSPCWRKCRSSICNCLIFEVSLKNCMHSQFGLPNLSFFYDQNSSSDKYTVTWNYWLVHQEETKLIIHRPKSIFTEAEPCQAQCTPAFAHNIVQFTQPSVTQYSDSCGLHRRGHSQWNLRLPASCAAHTSLNQGSSHAAWMGDCLGWRSIIYCTDKKIKTG